MIIKMIEGLDHFLKILLLCLATAMIATVTWQVLSRYILQNPSSITEEIARFQLIWLGLLGTAYAFRNHMHVKIDILSAGLSGNVKQCSELFSMLACMVFALVVLLYGGIKLVIMTYELDQRSAALGILMAYVYSAVPICGSLICIYAFYFFWTILSEKNRRQTNIN